MDDNPIPVIGYLKIATISDSTFLTFLNPYNNTIYGYEYGSRTLYRTIALESSGKLSGYEIISWDKILSYRYWDRDLTLHNGKGEALKSIKVPHVEEGYYALPTTHAPVISDGRSVYLAGGMKSREKALKTTPVAARVDTALTKVQQSHKLRAESKRLLEVAKKAVEIAIEQNEPTAMNWIKEQ